MDNLIRITFSDQRLIGYSWYHALRTVKIMAQEYGEATMTWRDVVIIFYRVV